MSESWKNDRAEASMKEHELKMMEKSRAEFLKKQKPKVETEKK